MLSAAVILSLLVARCTSQVPCTSGTELSKTDVGPSNNINVILVLCADDDMAYLDIEYFNYPATWFGITLGGFGTMTGSDYPLIYSTGLTGTQGEALEAYTITAKNLPGITYTPGNNWSPVSTVEANSNLRIMYSTPLVDVGLSLTDASVAFGWAIGDNIVINNFHATYEGRLNLAVPTLAPSSSPSMGPTGFPSMTPSRTTTNPSKSPSMSPTGGTTTPSMSPVTGAPSMAPLTGAPSVAPLTGAPSMAPLTGAPSMAPVTGAPSMSPVTGAPSMSPVVLLVTGVCGCVLSVCVWQGVQFYKRRNAALESAQVLHSRQAADGAADNALQTSGVGHSPQGSAVQREVVGEAGEPDVEEYGDEGERRDSQQTVAPSVVEERRTSQQTVAPSVASTTAGNTVQPTTVVTVHATDDPADV